MANASRPGSHATIDDPGIKQAAIDLTSYIMRKHYCENDVAAIIETLDEDDCFTWFGAGENEYAVGSKKVAAIFREFEGKILACTISDEHYEAIEPAPGVFLVSGQMWITTDPATNTFMRVHQRVTMGHRIHGGKLRCFHIHISNPYIEMTQEDVGFPAQMAKQSYDYLQEVIERQTRRLESQAAELKNIYSTIPCVIMRMRRTEHGYEPLMINPAAAELIGIPNERILELDWSKGYCELFAEEDALMADKLMKTLKKPGDRIEMVCKLRKASGDFIYVSSNNELVSRDEHGDIIQKIAFDVTRQVKLEQVLERQSFEDSLTGLFNRNKLIQELQTKRHDSFEQLGIAYLDINGLKAINDQKGHRAGDELIRRAADDIKICFSGKAYRIGGDEFAIIDDESTRDEFEKKLAAICQAMKKDGISISMGFSFRTENCSIEEQFDSADKRMYDAKGRFYRKASNDRRKH